MIPIQSLSFGYLDDKKTRDYKTNNAIYKKKVMVVGEHTSNTASQSTIEKTSTTRQPLNRRTKAQRAKDAEEEAKRAKKVHKLQALFAGEKRESIPNGFSAFKVSKEAERSSQFSQSSQPSQIKTSAPIDQTSSSFQPSIFGEANKT